MRKRKIWITIILICCALLFITACNKDSVVEHISLNDYSAEEPLKIGVGKFSYDDYSLSVTYDDGETQNIPLTEDMISETDKLKFFQEGKSSITITYMGATTSFEIDVARNVFAENVRLNSVNTVYTGKPVVVEVEGDYPGATDISYPQGNVFSNAGTYDMTAVLQCDGYESKVLRATVVIAKATYDLSSAQLYNETFTYDKNSHSIAVKGKAIENDLGEIVHESATLPKGVTVNYTITKVNSGNGDKIEDKKQQLVDGNKAIDAGVYKVCAKFKGDMSNYNEIPDSIAYLTIERAAYDTSKIEFVDKEAVYSGQEHSLSVSENSKIPTDVQVSYTIKRVKDGLGEEIASVETKGNSATLAGVYEVTATFTVIGKSADNYTTSPATKQAELTIKRAVYDMSRIELANGVFDYNGDTHSLFITNESELPESVSVSYQMKRVKDGKGVAVSDEFKAGNSEINAGEYLVKATFSIATDSVANYMLERQEQEAYLIILPASYDEQITDVFFNDCSYDFEENGTYVIYVECNLPDGVSPVFTLTNKEGERIEGVMDVENGSAEEGETVIKTVYKYSFSVETAGNYTCVVAFTHDNENYAAISLTFETSVIITAQA